MCVEKKADQVRPHTKSEQLPVRKCVFSSRVLIDQRAPYEEPFPRFQWRHLARDDKRVITRIARCMPVPTFPAAVSEDSMQRQCKFEIYRGAGIIFHTPLRALAILTTYFKALPDEAKLVRNKMVDNAKALDAN